jgi:HlyD family secretion protein
MKKRGVYILSTVAAVLATGFFLFGGFRGTKASPEFQLAEVERGNLEIVVSSTGTLSPLEAVNVGAEVSGTVQQVFADFNDSVKKGDLLALVDPTAYQAAVKEAKAAVQKTEAMLEKANNEYARNGVLYEKGHLSEFDYLSLKTAVKAADADLLSAQAKLAQVEANLENTKIRSPISGTVIERSIDAGQTIASSFQAPELFIIAKDLKQMQIEASVDENDIGQIKKGQRVRFTVQAYPDLSFNGTTRQVRLQPETVQNVVNYTVVVDVANDKGFLLPGMTATIDFVVFDHPDALLVPNGALSYKLPAPEAPAPSIAGFFASLVRGARATSEGPPAGSPARPAGNAPEGKSRVFRLGEDGYPRIAFFTPGESDGVRTEVLETADLAAGVKVITGASSTVFRKKATVGKNSLLPSPGGPGGGRRPF